MWSHQDLAARTGQDKSGQTMTQLLQLLHLLQGLPHLRLRLGMRFWQGLSGSFDVSCSQIWVAVLTLGDRSSAIRNIRILAVAFIPTVHRAVKEQ
jgi:hypothetical protein